MDFFAKKITIEGKKAKLGIWDSSGRQVFRSVWPAYYGNAVGVLLVYDITTYRSFKNIIKWYKDVAAHANALAVFLLIGNKSDLIKEREVLTENAEEFARSHNFLFMETSAMLNQNIEEVFQKLTQEIYARNLGVIYALPNQSRRRRNESEIRALRERRRHRRDEEPCCGISCIIKWIWS